MGIVDMSMGGHCPRQIGWRFRAQRSDTRGTNIPMLAWLTEVPGKPSYGLTSSPNSQLLAQAIPHSLDKASPSSVEAGAGRRVPIQRHFFRRRQGIPDHAKLVYI